VSGEMTDAATDELQEVIGVTPAVAFQGRPDAGPRSFGDVNKKKIMSI